MSDLNDEYLRGQRLRREGRLPEALAVFDQLVQRSPKAAGPREFRGLTLCNLDRFDEGLADLRAAIAMEPRNADFRSDLGFILFVLDRVDEAREQIERALKLSPGHVAALTNLSLVRLAQGDFSGAEKAARRALLARPGMFEASINLARALLSQGRFSEAWDAYVARPNPQVNPRDPHLAVPVPHQDRLPAAPSPVIVHGEQGLGDTLFYLRFAPQLRARGHRLAFWGDARLHPVLARSAVFEHFMGPEAIPAAGLAVVWAGDLPQMLKAHDPAQFPRALPLAGDVVRRQAMRERLQRFGPAPHIGLTWRAGLPRSGRIVLSKGVDLDAFGKALSGTRATFVSLQRRPADGETQHLAEAIGAPVHDASAVNDRLEDAAAMVEVLDDYIAVSNTNVHLRASAGRGARILVPWPPEWRWLANAERSPWFPDMPLYRQAPDKDWEASFARLREDLRAAYP
ncbi:MAG: tetratricopeptide repeat protein [Usitatibacter sp.]